MNTPIPLVSLFTKLSNMKGLLDYDRRCLAHAFGELCKVYAEEDIFALIQTIDKIFAVYKHTHINTLIHFVSLISNMETPMSLFIKSIDLIENLFSIKMILKKDYETNEKEYELMGVMYKLCHIYKDLSISELILLLGHDKFYFLNYILKKDTCCEKVKSTIVFETIKETFPEAEEHMGGLELLKTCLTELEEREMMAPDDTNMPKIMQFRVTINTFERMCSKEEPADIIKLVKAIGDIRSYCT
jgi:hypothetical protein